MLVWSRFQQDAATLPCNFMPESSCLTANSCPSLSISALEWWGVSYSLQLLSKDLVLLWPFQKLRAYNSCLLFQMPCSEWYFIIDSCVFPHWAVPWVLSLVPTVGVLPLQGWAAKAHCCASNTCDESTLLTVNLSALQWAESFAG